MQKCIFRRKATFEDLVFEKADTKKDDNSSRKCPLATGRRDICVTPRFARLSFNSDKMKKLFDGLQNINHKQYIGDLIKCNHFKPSCFY